MRMWNINPKLMCRKHLLGEHVEMHMFRSTILLGKSVDGYLRNGLVNLGEIKKRHDTLVKEMKDRGMNHKSPLYHFNEGTRKSVDVKNNEKEICRRCEDCRMRFKKVRGDNEDGKG